MLETGVCITTMLETGVFKPASDPAGVRVGDPFAEAAHAASRKTRPRRAKVFKRFDFISFSF
jgi:hypothetical protein